MMGMFRDSRDKEGRGGGCEQGPSMLEVILPSVLRLCFLHLVNSMPGMVGLRRMWPSKSPFARATAV